MNTERPNITQLHTTHHGLGIVRPTNDVDIVLHIETLRGVPNKVVNALELSAEHRPAHRFVRGTTKVDLVAGTRKDQVDVLIAAPQHHLA